MGRSWLKVLTPQSLWNNILWRNCGWNYKWQYRVQLRCTDASNIEAKYFLKLELSWGAFVKLENWNKVLNRKADLWNFCWQSTYPYDVHSSGLNSIYFCLFSSFLVFNLSTQLSDNVNLSDFRLTFINLMGDHGTI